MCPHAFFDAMELEVPLSVTSVWAFFDATEKGTAPLRGIF